MSYYSTLEVLALCDALDKVPHIRQGANGPKRSIGDSIENGEVKIPKLSKPYQKHDFLELDSVYKDKKQHPVPKAYNDDVIKQQILSSSEAANSSQSRPSFMPQQSGSLNDTHQQQARALQNKKALQHQHFQNSSSRLPGLSTPTAFASPQALNRSSITSTPTTPTLHKHFDTYTPRINSKNNSASTSRSSTPGITPHNAGQTLNDDGTHEECEFCHRIFRGPKSSTHKQQHIKRIHPDSYVRKKGGIKRDKSFTTIRFD